MATEYIALIPAYEPDERMLRLIADLRSHGFRIVTVDDGSGEEYSEIFAGAEEEATVLTHPVNRGKGAALKTGLSYIGRYMVSGGYLESSGRSTDVTTVIVTVDADGQHLSSDALRIARAAAGRPGQLVLGSRAFKGDVPLRSRLGNSITRQVFRMATGVAVCDTQTGLRAFTSDMIPRMLSIEGDRYEYEINMLLAFAREGVPIIEEKIETVYIDNNSSSHFSMVRDSARIYKEILKFSASSFVGFLVDYGLFALLMHLTGILALANIGARIVSSVTNYAINRRLVFRSKAGVTRSALQYFALVALILAGNTIVLKTITETFGTPYLAAKIATEVIFFAISWLVQRYVIFYSEQERPALPAPAIRSDSKEADS